MFGVFRRYARLGWLFETAGAAPPPGPFFLLLEGGAGFLLQEDGVSRIILE